LPTSASFDEHRDLLNHFSDFED